MLNPVPLPVNVEPEPACPGFYQEAGAHDRPEFLEDARLAGAIAVHIANLLSPRRRRKRPARTLLILGPPSSGKTEGTRVITSRLGADLLYMPGADLLAGGGIEGAPVDKLELAFKWMRWHSHASGRVICLLLDDIDTLIEERPEQERTINSNLLVGKMQAIGNSLDVYTTGNGTPIPMLWTANSTRFIRPALIRAGRCTIYRHAQTWQDKARIIEHLFQPDSTRDRRRLHKLVYCHSDRPIDFFEQLRADVTDEAVAAAVRAHGLDPNAIDAADEASDRLDIDALYAAAERRRNARGGEFLT